MMNPTVLRSGNTSGKVLVVDDEPMVRRLVTTVLIHSGYEVAAAENAEQAVAVMERDSSVSLLLTDVVMPGGNGCELATRLRQRRPSLKVLFMSGYGTLPTGTGALLAKPFRIDDLLDQVRQSLSRD